jgi:hypothetical protein
VEVAALMKTLVQQGKELSVWSWTVAVRGDDISMAEVEGVESLLKEMKSAGIIQDGIMVLERGEVEKHLHCQIMLQSNFKDSNAFNATNVMREMLDKKRVFARSFCNQVVKHKLDENRDWLSLAGCASFTRVHLQYNIAPQCYHGTCDVIDGMPVLAHTCIAHACCVSQVLLQIQKHCQHTGTGRVERAVGVRRS